MIFQNRIEKMNAKYDRNRFPAVRIRIYVKGEDTDDILNMTTTQLERITGIMSDSLGEIHREDLALLDSGDVLIIEYSQEVTE